MPIANLLTTKPLRLARLSKRARQSGFTLIEILVALIILSIGLLGMASLQLNGLRSNQSAYLRSQASLLAYDMADRLRANSVRAIAGDYDDFDTDGAVPTNPNCIAEATGCTAENQADTDLAEWAQRVNGTGDAIVLLPDAKGTIDRGLGNQFTISIIWKETEWDEASGAKTVSDQDFSVNLVL